MVLPWLVMLLRLGVDVLYLDCKVEHGMVDVVLSVLTSTKNHSEPIVATPDALMLYLRADLISQSYASNSQRLFASFFLNASRGHGDATTTAIARHLNLTCSRVADQVDRRFCGDFFLENRKLLVNF